MKPTEINNLPDGSEFTGKRLTPTEMDEQADRLVDAFNLIADFYGITTVAGKRALRLAMSNIQILDQKHRDYGKDNIASFGELGVAVRCQDKVSRLGVLVSGHSSPEFETVNDTWMDLANYAIIGQMVNEGKWPA